MSVLEDRDEDTSVHPSKLTEGPNYHGRCEEHPSGILVLGCCLDCERPDIADELRRRWAAENAKGAPPETHRKTQELIARVDGRIYPHRHGGHYLMGPPEHYPCCRGRGYFPGGCEDSPCDRYCSCAAGRERKRVDK